jgi:hypothetical protein
MQNKILLHQSYDEKILKFITLCSQFHCAVLEEEPLVGAQNTTHVVSRPSSQRLGNKGETCKRAAAKLCLSALTERQQALSTELINKRNNRG